jgi:hypothetical protein
MSAMACEPNSFKNEGVIIMSNTATRSSKEEGELTIELSNEEDTGKPGKSSVVV